MRGDFDGCQPHSEPTRTEMERFLQATMRGTPSAITEKGSQRREPSKKSTSSDGDDVSGYKIAYDEEGKTRKTSAPCIERSLLPCSIVRVFEKSEKLTTSSLASSGKRSLAFLATWVLHFRAVSLLSISIEKAS